MNYLTPRETTLSGGVEKAATHIRVIHAALSTIKALPSRLREPSAVGERTERFPRAGIHFEQRVFITTSDNLEISFRYATWGKDELRALSPFVWSR